MLNPLNYSKKRNCNICNEKSYCLIIKHIDVKQCIVCNDCISQIFHKCPVCQTSITSKNYGEYIFNEMVNTYQNLIVVEVNPIEFRPFRKMCYNITPNYKKDHEIYPSTVLETFVYHVFLNNFKKCQDFLKNKTFYKLLKNTQYDETINITLKLLEEIYNKRKEYEIYKLLIKFLVSLENSKGHEFKFQKYDFYKIGFYKEHVGRISIYDSLKKCDKMCKKDKEIIIMLLILKQRNKIIILPGEIIVMIYKQLFNLEPCLCLFKLIDKNMFFTKHDQHA